MENPKASRSVTDSDPEIFPFEIIIEILSRLPVKALARFTTVCKLWYSQITSPTFISTHLKNYSISIANNQNLANLRPYILLMPSYIKELEKYSYSLIRDGIFVGEGTFDIPMLYSRLDLLFVGNSCNGIICFTHQGGFYGRKVFLFNPSIRRIKLISRDTFADVTYESHRVYSRLGFGFCKQNDDFKVVRIHYVKDEDYMMLGKVPLVVEVYSLSADCWRRIRASIKCIVNHRSVSCNGSIYWLARRKHKLVCDTIMLFDIANEVFHEIALPAECFSSIDGTLLVIKGLLALLKDDFSNAKSFEVWIMREHNMTQSWTKLDILEISKPILRAFGFTKSGKLVMKVDSGMLAYWDTGNDQLKDLEIDGTLTHVDAAFAESLVLYGGRSLASVDTKAMVASTSPSIGIVQSWELLTSTYKIAIHGDDVMVRVAGDVASVDCGVNELKNLCWRYPTLSLILEKSKNMPLTMQLCAENYCLIVLLHGSNLVPQSLKDFLAQPEVCFMTGIRGISGAFEGLNCHTFEIGYLGWRFLGMSSPHKIQLGKDLCEWELKTVAAKVGVTLEDYTVRSQIDWKAKVLSKEELKLAIYHAYAYYKVGCKLFCLF